MIPMNQRMQLCPKSTPSPYIIGRRMWHPDHSKAAYPTREKLMAACVPVLRQEISAVRNGIRQMKTAG